MSRRRRPQSVPCFHGRHVSYDGSDTLYASDDISLSRLKLDDDAPPLTREIPRSPATAGQPSPRFMETPETPVSADGANSRSMGTPESLVSAGGTRRKSRIGPFPGEWPKTWDEHPTTPGLLWIHRRWTDGESPSQPELYAPRLMEPDHTASSRETSTDFTQAASSTSSTAPTWTRPAPSGSRRVATCSTLRRTRGRRRSGRACTRRVRRRRGVAAPSLHPRRCRTARLRPSSGSLGRLALVGCLRGRVLGSG